MKVLATAGDISALIADVRLRVPLTAWAAQYGGSVVWRSFHDCSRADLAAAEVLVLQRGTSARACWLAEAMHARGGSVVYDIDDLITEIAPHISHHERSSAFLPWVRRCMRHSDLVTVSTARLGAALNGLAPACMEVPNHAFSAGELPLPVHDGARPVSLLFASSDRLAAEFLYPVLRRLDAHRADAQPPRFTRMDLHYTVTGQVPPDAVARAIIPFLRFFSLAFYPVIFVFSRIARFATRLVGGATSGHTLFITREELSAYLVLLPKQ